jgi:hypothetical protein
VTKVDDLLAYAGTEIGKPYVFGDEGPNSFDCSGLMQWVYKYVGIALPRTAHEQQAATTATSNPQPGDLVFFGNPAYHVGLYIGDGKMISAPSAGHPVHITGVGTPTNYGRVAGLGAGLAPLTGATATVTSWLSGGVDALVDKARNSLLELTVAALGLALVGAGIYRAVVAPTVTRALNPTGGS